MKHNYYNDDDEDLDEDIFYLYQLRHQLNIFGLEYISKKLNVSCDRLENLYNSRIHGSTYIADFISDDKNFNIKFKYFKNESRKIENTKEFARIKNNELIYQLQSSRENFCGIGTNKIKRRLNKLSKTDIIAKSIRLLLEIEDCNIQAKKYIWM